MLIVEVDRRQSTIARILASYATTNRAGVADEVIAIRGKGGEVVEEWWAECDAGIELVDFVLTHTGGVGAGTQEHLIQLC